MRAVSLFFIIVLAYVLPAEARIGETLEQCKARYGEATAITAKPPAEEAYRFVRSGILVVVFMVNKRVDLIMYRPVASSGALPELSETQRDFFLSANGDGVGWNAVPGVRVTLDWLRSDGKVGASYDPADGVMMVMTVAYRNAHREQEAAAEKKALNGF